MADYTLDQVYDLLKIPKNNLQTKISYSNAHKTKGKSINTTIGKLWFSLLLPETYPFITEQVNKKKLAEILNDINTKYDSQVVSSTLTKINKEGYYLGTINPTSLTPDSFNIPPHLKKRAKDLLDPKLKPEEFVANITTLGKEYLEWLKVNDDGLYDMVSSGARSNPTDIGTLLFAIGPLVGIDGIVSKPSLGSINEGFNIEDWYKSADQSRFTLFTRSIGTAEPGALAREVFFSNSNIQLDFNSDCRTKRFLELTITPSIRSIINGRYYLNEKTNNLEKITQDTDNILNKVIKLRSPIYCKQPNNNICSVCYGELGERLQTRNIGLLSGTIINLAGIQGYAMKMRHNSSQVQLRPANFIKDFIRI